MYGFYIFLILKKRFKFKDVLNSSTPYYFLNKNVNFNKNETVSKWSSTHTFREINLVL